VGVTIRKVAFGGSGFIRGVAFGGSDYKKGGLWWERLYKGRLLYMYISYKYYQVVRIMVFKVTFNNISIILWRKQGVS
jgi:hypothetical protein